MKSVFSALSIVSLTILSFGLSAQEIGIDNKGGSVFTFFEKDEYRLKVDFNEVSLATSFRNRSYTVVRVNRATDTRTPTVQKFRGWFAKASMLNADDYLLVNDLADLRPGLGLKFGYQKSVDTFSNIRLIPTPYQGTYTVAWNLIFNIDNIKLYDTTKDEIDKRCPLTIGGEMSVNYFFKYINRRGHRFALAWNTKLVRTWNDDDLLNYEELDNVIINGSVVALEKFSGRYGALKNITKFRTSLSVPIYIWHFNPIPYSVLNVLSESSPIWHVGVFTNILSKKLPIKGFTIPSAFGFGVDCTKKNGKFGKAHLFFSGSLKL